MVLLVSAKRDLKTSAVLSFSIWGRLDTLKKNICQYFLFYLFGATQNIHKVQVKDIICNNSLKYIQFTRPMLYIFTYRIIQNVSDKFQTQRNPQFDSR